MWLVKRKLKSGPTWYVNWCDPDQPDRRIVRPTGEVSRGKARKRGAELEAAWLAERDRLKAGAGIATEAVIAQYFDTDLSKLKWAASARKHLDRIADAYGDRPYCLLTTADAARLVDTLSATLSDSTINRFIAAWRRMHNVAAERRELPVQTIRWKSLTRDEPEGRTVSLTQEQVRSIVSRLPKHLVEIVAFAVLTACRRSQITTLTWDRVDLDAGTVVVFRKHRKRDVRHTIDLHPKAAKIVAQRLAVAGEPAPTDRVFNATNFQHAWERAVWESGLTDVRFHDLRHTAASWHVRNGTPSMVLKEIMGHSTVRMTERYSHVTRADVRAHTEALPAPDLIDE